MFPPEDAPPAARLSRWLDGWLAPRWRALLTWAILAAVSVAAEYLLRPDGMKAISWLPVDFIERLLPVTVPYDLRELILAANTGLLFVWFEPLVLRLNLLRGAAWLGLRIAPFVLARCFSPMFWLYSKSAHDLCGVAFIASLAVQPLPLLYWRSRPWMPFVSTAMAIVASQQISDMIPDGEKDWGSLIFLSLVYAVPLLYGTRLLRPEERVRRGG